jgi:hypothetical protein
MPPFQYWFTGGAVAAFLALLTTVVTASCTLGYAWYRAAVTELQTDQASQQKIVNDRAKALLGSALGEGRDLYVDIGRNPPADQGEARANAWAQKAYDLIKAAYGEGEAELFKDDSGYVFFSGNGAVRNWIDGRMRRITELLQRADSLTVKKDFDPSKFKPADQSAKTPVDK